MRFVAVVVRMFVEGADQRAHDRLEQAVGAAIASQGGPPDGLMVHIGQPAPNGDGFLLVDVWRSEGAFRAWRAATLEPALAAADLRATEPEVAPVWSFARP